MKVLLDKEKLHSCLIPCSNIVDKKATMPILANIHISAKGNQLTISATDLEVTAVISTDAEVAAEGSTTINARIISDIVKELPDGQVELELTEGERLLITAGGAKIKVIGVNADEYPNLPGIGINATASVSATKFLDMINKTIYAASDDETSFNLTGVYFCNYSDQLRLVATDGHRISIITRDVDALKLPEGVIVPKKGLSEIKKHLSELSDAEVGISIEDGFLIVNSNNAKYSVRLIDADFPDYQQVVPKDKTSQASVKSQDLGKALRRVSLLATDKMKGVKMKFSTGKLEVASSSPELGEAKEEMEIEYSGEPVEIGFNSIYIQDIISSLSDYDELSIDLNGSLGPGRFLANDDPECFSVVMPMRIN